MAIMRFLSQDNLRMLVDENAYLVIDYLLKKVAFSQPEVNIPKKKTDIQIPKEFLESWIAQACKLETIGAGNYPIDNYKKDEYGIDVKFVSAKTNEKGEFVNSDSNETSLAQNFKGFGKSLDQLFEAKAYEAILEGWINILKTKLEKPLKDLNLKKLY